MVRSQRALDTIRIEALELSCIVGVRPRERRRRQTVRIDLQLGLDLSHAGRSGRITQTCDYSLVIDQVTALLQFREYQLIEGATEELAAMLFGVHSVIDEVTIQLEKPAALYGRARAAAVRISRARADYPMLEQAQSYGTRTVLLESHEAGLYLYGIEPGQTLEAEPQDLGRRLEWLVSGALERGSSALIEGEPRRADGSALTNRADRRALLFACTASH